MFTILRHCAHKSANGINKLRKRASVCAFWMYASFSLAYIEFIELFFSFSSPQRAFVRAFWVGVGAREIECDCIICFSAYILSVWMCVWLKCFNRNPLLTFLHRLHIFPIIEILFLTEFYAICCACDKLCHNCCIFYAAITNSPVCTPANICIRKIFPDQMNISQRNS